MPEEHKPAPIVKVQELNADDYAFSDREKEWYTLYLLSQKSNEPLPESENAEAEYDQLKKKRRIQQNILRGMKYVAVITDGKSANRKVLFVSPMLYKTEFAADRCGQRYIRRYNQTGSFNK